MDIQEIRGEDGLWRCSVCGEVTRGSIEIFGTTRNFRIRCQCQMAAKAKEEELLRQEADAKAARELRKMSMMDEKLKDASFSTFVEDAENRKAHMAAVRYAEKFGEMLKTGQGLMFYGPVGTGKDLRKNNICVYCFD